MDDQGGGARRVRTLILASAFLLALPAVSQGQPTRGEECLEEYARLGNPMEGAHPAAGCLLLASDIVDVRTREFYEGDLSAFADSQVKRAVKPRDIQSTAPQGAATGGSAAQNEAVPGIQPLALAGGAVAAAGNDAGANAIVAVTLNPAAFVVPTDTAGARLARASRFSDVTVLFPATSFDESEDFAIDYIGLRARINVTGLSRGSRVMDRATELFGELVVNEQALLEDIQALLETAPDVVACTRALLEGLSEEGPCGGRLEEVDRSRYEVFRRQLEAAREIADSEYFGLDLRTDFGDPTLGAVDNARGTVIMGGVAYGREMIRTGRETSTWGFKTRLGLRYTDLEDVDETNLSVDGGFALELLSRYQFAAIRVSTGIEFRYGDAPDDLEEALRTDLGEWRTSLTVPVSDANAVSMSFAVPFSSDIGPTFNVNLNWGLLLPGG